MPAVSVVLPTYRRPQLLGRAVASVYAQTFADWELIITDDEEPPGETWDYLTELASTDVRVRIARNLGPHGQSGNVNNGLRLARADWVKLLFDDDVLRPQCLEVMVGALGGDRSIAVASCLSERYRGGRAVGTTRIGRRSRLERLAQRHAHLAMYLQDVDIGPPAKILVNRACIEQGTFFEEREGLFVLVDAWWIARLLQHGDLLLIAEVLVEEHQGEHVTVTSSASQDSLDAEFQLMRRLIHPLIEPELDPPSLVVMTQSMRLIRAMNRLAQRRPYEAFRLALSARQPQAWWLAARWFLRRSFPGRFELVKRRKVDRREAAK